MTITRTKVRAVAVTAVLAGAALAAGATSAATSNGARAPARHARAELFDADDDPVGTAHFVEDGTGRVHVNVKVAGLPPGLHGIHVHAAGNCTVTPAPPAPNMFSLAGGHHNPDGATHGGHAGDLPNLVVNGAGRGRLNDATIRLALSPGATSIFDANRSALIIHADPDDYLSDPTGNSGERIACGVITPS